VPRDLDRLPALDVLGLVPGLDVEQLGTYCCGLSGTYGFKSEKYDISLKIGAELASLLKKSKSPMALSDCEACRMQIENISNKKALHPIMILQKAYGIEDDDRVGRKKRK